jgi:Family of unknown function (DUF5565)
MASHTFSFVESCAVLDKVPAMFHCEHVEGTQTGKFGRAGQKYLATTTLTPELVVLLEEGVSFKVTAKVDGTSTIVRNGRLLKRRDQKFDKRKGKKKNMPNSWIQTGIPSEKHGVGYMPLEKGDKWFFDVFERDPDNANNTDKNGHPMINEELSTRVRVVQFNKIDKSLTYEYIDLSDLNGKSFELMGPKIQCNSHSLQFHALMEHGLIECATYPEVTVNNPNLLDQIKEWHSTDPLGQAIEGVVLHFESGQMFKLHRHHLDMEWGHNSNENVTPLFDVQF